MSLRERLSKKKCTEVEITVAGETFLVIGLPKSERARVYASISRPGKPIDSDAMENAFLAACVSDPETREPVYPSDEADLWGGVPSEITGPLFSEVMKRNGLDNDDVGRKVKNSETTDLPA